MPSSTSPSPTLVFVPGAWHGPCTWSKVTKVLTSPTHNVRCISVELPSTVSRAAVFKDDVAAVRAAVTTELSQSRDVVLVVHSYGSLPGASALKGLRMKKASVGPEEGETGDNAEASVIGFVSISTGFPASNVVFADAFEGGKPPPWIVEEEGLARINTDPAELFYHDLPAEEAAEWVGKLREQSYRVLDEGREHVYAGWKDVPQVWYLATRDDRALPVEVQRGMVEKARSEVGDGRVVLREVDSGHSPMLSRADETVAFIMDAAEAFTK